MRTDSISLTELGFLPDASGAWPLGLWLDTTHSTAGCRALKEFIASPLNDVDEIKARQGLLQALAPIGKKLPWRDLQRLAAQVERYLASNYVVVPVAPLDLALFTIRFRDIVADVTIQLHAVDALLTLSDQICSRIRAIPADATFAVVVEAFASAVNHPQRQSLRSAVASGRGVAALDRLVRAPKAPQSMRDAVSSLIAAIAQLDAFCSIANASSAIAGSLPSVVPKGSGGLDFDGLRHPLLPEGVANDWALTNDERVCFLTGPNMAGKSTLLRATGIAVYCAHLGMATTARHARIPLYDELLVSITVRDNLLRGESLYLAEVRRVRRIVEAVDRGNAVLAIFDEVFRGTNVKDATQATCLLVDGLARAPFGTFVIASHLAEVAESRETAAGVGCWCMKVETADTPRFSYRVGRGVSDVHLGMVLLDAEGVGPMLRRMAAN